MATRVRIPDVVARAQAGERISIITAYDAFFGRLVDEAGADIVLVGDSVGNVVLGHRDTTAVTLADMVSATASVARGVKRAAIIADLPFGAYGADAQPALDASVALVRAGAHGVKLEGDHPETTRTLVRAGIPVMAHVGFTPQSINALGGHRRQGTSEEAETSLSETIGRMRDAGAFAVVLELLPEDVARRLTEAHAGFLTIGIGAGAGCRGQVQVLHDVLGFGRKLAHADRRMEGEILVREALAAHVHAVREGAFPPVSANTPSD